MIKKIAAIILVSLLLSQTFGFDPGNVLQDKKQDPWFAIDKLKHLSSSFMVTTTGYYIQNKIAGIPKDQSINTAGIITISLGICKEINDSRKPRGMFSIRDLITDAVGVCLAITFIQAIS